MCLKSYNEIRTPQCFEISRSRQSPELGPRMLFFSGGTALRAASQRLIDFTYNSIHILTPFDSGGSSATLRQAFDMPAVGDIRNRLMALADPHIQGNAAVLDLFGYRLPAGKPQNELIKMLLDFIQARHPLVRALPRSFQDRVCSHLQAFLQNMPTSFELAGASIGNLALTAGYLENNRDINAVISMYSRFAHVRGIVRPVVQGNYHLGAYLANGQRIVGQHLLTGKQTARIVSPIKSIFLTQDFDPGNPCPVQVDDGVRDLISRAELICFPMGSFFTSLLAQLLPQGVAASIQNNQCPKVFVPNTYPDPECLGLSIQEQIQLLLGHMYQGSQRKGLMYVLMDSCLDRYPGPVNIDSMNSKGLEVIKTPLVTSASAPAIDPNCLVQALLSLV
ncbi:MAG: GAK system CofD-like protein [Desulfovermiculus sp.]